MILVFVYRRHIVSLVERTEEVTLPGGAAAKISRKIEEARSKSQKLALEETAEDEAAVPQGIEADRPLDDPYFEPAERFPEAAVMEAFKKLGFWCG